MSACNISIYSSGQILTKAFSLVDGDLMKRPGGHMTSGKVERVTITCPNDLADKVLNLKTHQALGFGLSSHDIAYIVAQGMLDKIQQDATTPTIARTAQNIAFAKGKPGIMMLDVDAPKDGTLPLTREQAIALIISVCPELARAPMVICDSASSHIWNSETGEQLIGAGGLRIYIFVADASDIPRAGKVLFKRLILAGHIRIELSSAGTMLVRSIIDSAVWQAERLDFAAGAHCLHPLAQRRPTPEAFNNDAGFLDTRQALPDLTEAEGAQYERIVDAAKDKMRPEAEQVREAWLENKVEAELKLRGMYSNTHPEEAQIVRDRLTRAATTSVLEKDFVLYTPNREPITVAELFADPEKYHKTGLADPLDPGCYNDWRIAVALLKGGEPRIFSHAHGGAKYFLQVLDANDFETLPADGGTEARQTAKVSPRDKLRALTVTKEYCAMLGKEKWLLQNLIIKGQILTVVAKSGGGKTAIFFDYVAPLIISNHDMNVYYFDCDSPASDHDRMLSKVQEIGPRFQWINPLTHGKGPEVLIDALKEFVASGERLDDAFFVLDTLKKFIDMLDKKSVKPFFSLLRQLTALGATIVLLGHANKHRDNDGNLVFEGVGDVASDTDAMIIFERVKSADDGIDITTICDPDKGAKVRGLYKPMSFHVAPDRTVTLCRDVVPVPDYSRDAAKKGRLTEEDIQERIREYLEEQKDEVHQQQIIDNFKGESGASFHAVRKVLIACAVPEHEATMTGQIFVRAAGLYNQKLYGVFR